ncbi:hypothetical protein BDW02DRAFT_523546 [Decorospora gaudefroyi]|uniref:DH domain-containing protein n=1 Tax=Decorospora gaudefroyi TaxID=184978 RepID=A0A6A5KGM5_9PLEO|nr:hypothetical protein BDW02DRAFT_523546 [Decorospora gaudefroyi]
MAYVLSLRPHSPLKRSFSDNPYLDSCSPHKDTLLAPLGDITARNGSACSLYSLGANRAGDWSRGHENAPPLTSQSLLDLVPEKTAFPFHARDVAPEPRKRSCGPDRPLPSFSHVTAPSDPYSRGYQKSQRGIEPSLENDNLEPMDIEENDMDETQLYNLYEAIHVPVPAGRLPHNTDGEAHDEQEAAPETAVINSQPFRRWMSTLRRRHAQRWKDELTEVPRLSFDTTDGNSFMSRPPGRLSESVRRTSESMSSSMGYVTAVKSASMTVGSTSIAPRSDAGLQGKVRLGNRSSNYSEARRSLESHRGALGPVLDESAWLRSLQRRKIVEELIASEESYIADLKVLINASHDYFMILTALPTLSGQTRSSIQHNISQILQLHEDLLAELHQVVPQADLTRSAHQETYPVTKAKHIRFHSADIIPGRFAEHKATRRLRHSLEIGRSPDRRPRGLVTDTQTAGNIARIFNTHMKRFFTYEEYGAHWTTMSQELTTLCKGLHGWREYERGVEALQKVVASENNREAGSKKALSFPDLLIKPIQRVCKYPLLFDDLCRHTPVYDDPEAHAELEKALFRLQETIREVNKAKDDPKTRRLIEITWQLQDRLAFQEQKISRALVFRLLGHVLLCGVLHVTYQTPDRIKGSYMVCVLYKSCLVLATASRFHTPYTVVASVGLANASIEESDNGRGLQCHTAANTWKFVFEHGHRLHELMFSACTAQEEEVWKKQLRERIVYETHDFVEGQSTMQDMFTSLTLELKSLGPVFGHANSVVRRMSVHRAATLGAKTNMSQVIIKNTQAQKLQETPPTFSPSIVTRSQSHLSSNHIPTLAPRRAERIRLETTLEDVWTKDLLPFPGMSNRRVENQIRASANSVMRKLSMASIASNFSRRSPSFSGASNTRSDDSFGSRVHKISQGNLRAQSATDRRPAPAVVDFHNAPAAFLPTDFELEDTRPLSRRRRLATRAMGSERPNEKCDQDKPKKVRRLSAQMISLPRSDSSVRLTESTPSHGSTATTLRGPPPCVDVSRSMENRKMMKKKEDEKEGDSRAVTSSAMPSKKFLKSKSRILNFFR